MVRLHVVAQAVSGPTSLMLDGLHEDLFVTSK